MTSSEKANWHLCGVYKGSNETGVKATCECAREGSKAGGKSLEHGDQVFCQLLYSAASRRQRRFCRIAWLEIAVLVWFILTLDPSPTLATRDHMDVLDKCSIAADPSHSQEHADSKRIGRFGPGQSLNESHVVAHQPSVVVRIQVVELGYAKGIGDDFQFWTSTKRDSCSNVLSFQYIR